MELLKLKMLLGIPEGETASDSRLSFIMDDVKETILNYCRLEELPQGLENTACRMAMDLYRYERPGEEEAAMVTSVSTGGTSTSFGTAADVLKDSLLKNYRLQLNRYRKLG